MTDEPSDNVVKLADAFDKAERRKGGKKKEAKPARPKFTPPPQLTVLPEDCPVIPLGRQGRVFYFLNALGELVEYKDSEIGRLGILSLFGGDEYLKERWPSYNQSGFTGDFDHGAIAPILIEACTRKGVWDPVNFVRGPGTWSEDDGTLVMHCGEYLWVDDERLHTGVRGRYLYPKGAALPEPTFRKADPGGDLLHRLQTWNWVRAEADPRIMLGWIVAALIGQAQPWRPALWVTGGRGRGKSTLQKLVNWVLSDEAIVQLEDTSGPAIYRTIGDSALPVALDEFEAQADNQRAEGILKLARIAASGGTVARVGGDGKVQRFKLRNCFLFSSILIPPLSAANKSRLAICELLPLERGDMHAEKEFDAALEGQRDPILGAKEDWREVGCALRGRVITGWKRYHQTFQSYRHELLRAGHDTRAAEQFGSLGAAFDLAMYDAFDPAAAKEWAEMLPARDLAEVSGYLSEPEACLKHLLSAMMEPFRSGAKESVAHYLREARSETERGIAGNDPADARRALEKIGIRVWRDRRESFLWWAGISATHQGLNAIFAGTHWKGMPGAPGTWAQALGNLPGAARRVRLRVDGDRDYLVPIPWQTLFPPYEAEADSDERELVSEADQTKTVKEGLR